jgi:transcriptional regulator with XRE-family HTH domain
MTTEDKKPHINVDYFEGLTGDIEEKPPDEVEEIGERVKNLRQSKGLSLDQLAHLTGFDVQFLADIETNKVHPQLGTVIKLSKALSSAFGRLVSGSGDRLYSITRKGDRQVVSRSTSQKGQKKLYTYKSLSPGVKGRNMEALMVQLEKSPDEEMSVHEGEEFIFVLDGVVELRIADELFELLPGDSVYYLSTTPHLIAAKEESATIVAVLYEG